MFEEMSLEEIKDFVTSNRDEAKGKKEEIIDRLAVLCWDIGLVWGKLENIDPYEGELGNRLGTENVQSHTYKMREAAEYVFL